MGRELQTMNQQNKLALLAERISACRDCGQGAKAWCQDIIPCSFTTPQAIAHIMAQKFVIYSPLHRQEHELKRQGIALSRQTMANWILKASQDYLEPVYE